MRVLESKPWQDQHLLLMAEPSLQAPFWSRFDMGFFVLGLTILYSTSAVLC